jgi:hypothetical protein
MCRWAIAGDRTNSLERKHNTASHLDKDLIDFLKKSEVEREASSLFHQPKTLTLGYCSSLQNSPKPIAKASPPGSYLLKRCLRKFIGWGAPLKQLSQKVLA